MSEFEAAISNGNLDELGRCQFTQCLFWIGVDNHPKLQWNG